MSWDIKKEGEVSTKDQQIEQQKDIIQKLKASNEKLQRKLEYYENFLENIAQFEKSQNILQMKAFSRANMQKFDQLIEQYYESKEDLEIERMTTAELRAKLNMRSTPDLSSTALSPLMGSQDGSANDKVMRLEAQLKAISKEMEQVNEKNRRLVQSLSKKDFFHEYELLLKEVEGLRKQNLMMQDKLKQKQ